MTLERKKAILVLIVTLIVGIIIGTLSTSIMARHHYRGHEKQRSHFSVNRNVFINKIIRITDADSVQLKQMRPMITQTMVHIDSLENHSRQKVKAILDSMNLRFKSILRPEQMKKLHDFNAKMSHARHRERR